MKLMYIFLLSLMTHESWAQKIPDSLRTADKETISQYFLQKSKHQKTAGFVLLGLGAGMITLVSVLEFEQSGFGPSAEEALFGLGGAAAVITSIPLFLAAGKNKRWAAKVVAGPTTIRLLPGMEQKQASVGFSIAFD